MSLTLQRDLKFTQVTCCAVSPDDQTLCYVFEGTISTINAADGQIIKTTKAHDAMINDIHFSNNGQFIVTAGLDNAIKIWNTKTLQLEKTFTHSDKVLTCSFSPDDRLLISGSNDKTAKIWEVSTGKVLKSITEHQAVTFRGRFSPSGKQFATGGYDNKLFIWNTDTFQCMAKLDHTGPVLFFYFSPDEKYIVSGALGTNILKVWSLQNYQCIATLQGHVEPVRTCFWSPNGKYIISREATCVKLWSTDSWKCVNTITASGYSAISKSGKTALFGNSVYATSDFSIPPPKPTATKSEPIIQVKDDQHTSATVVYLRTCDLAQDLISENYPNITKVLIRPDTDQFHEKLTDSFILTSSLILILSEGTLDNSNCIMALQMAVKEKKKVVLVHDTTSVFPQYSKIQSLPAEVQSVFSSIAVPLIAKYTKNCWKKIADKLFDRIIAPKPMNWFLSHKQITGQRIALSLFLELKELGETSFLDVKTELDLHDLEKLIELCDFFVFIYSDGILESEYCRKELEFAIKCKKLIMVVRDFQTPIPTNIPPQWMPFEKILKTPRIQLFSAYYLSEFAEVMRQVRKEPTKPEHRICYCDPSYY